MTPYLPDMLLDHDETLNWVGDAILRSHDLETHPGRLALAEGLERFAAAMRATVGHPQGNPVMLETRESALMERNALGDLATTLVRSGQLRTPALRLDAPECLELLLTLLGDPAADNALWAEFLALPVNPSEQIRQLALHTGLLEDA
jgi:hypothetical protein